MTRVFDLLFSTLAILLLFPLLVPVCIALKLTGEHDIFYRQTRVGRFGKEFGLLKFATMLRNSPNLSGGLYTGVNDPRMLPFGKILRKTKINELPQLFNIFVGQMSIVGFRPTVPEHFRSYPEYARKKLYDSQPGLTGIGSIVFRDEENILQSLVDKKSFHQNIISPYKAALECWYVEHKSIGNYFILIFLTAQVVLMPKNYLWKKLFKELPPIPVELIPYI